MADKAADLPASRRGVLGLIGGAVAALRAPAATQPAAFYPAAPPRMVVSRATAGGFCLDEDPLGGALAELATEIDDHLWGFENDRRSAPAIASYWPRLPMIRDRDLQRNRSFARHMKLRLQAERDIAAAQAETCREFAAFLAGRIAAGQTAAVAAALTPERLAQIPDPAAFAADLRAALAAEALAPPDWLAALLAPDGSAPPPPAPEPRA